MNDCKKCPASHRKICETTLEMCAMAESFVNGNAPMREKIAKPEALQHLPQAAYGEKLWELMRDKEATDLERLEAIRAIDSRIPTLLKKKIILANTLAGITQEQISDFSKCHMDRSRVSRIARVEIVAIK